VVHVRACFASEHQDLAAARGVSTSSDITHCLQHGHDARKFLCRQKKKSAALADAVTLGDAWLAPAIQQGALQPIPTPERWRWWVRQMPILHNIPTIESILECGHRLVGGMIPDKLEHEGHACAAFDIPE
jgi:hypothetical protein